MIFQFAKKLQRFLDYRVLLRIAQAIAEHFAWLSSKFKKNSLFLFSNFTVRKAKKRLLKLQEHSELNNFTNIVAEIDVNALKI